MRWGVSTMIWEKSGIPLTESLKRIAGFGFSLVDLAGIGTGDASKMSFADKTALKGLVRNHGLQIAGTVLLEANNLATLDPEFRKRQMEYCRSAALFQHEIGGGHVLLCWGCGSVALGQSRSEAWATSRSFIVEFCDWARTAAPSVRVILEFDPAMFYVVRDVATLEQMLTEVSAPNLFANIDIAHMNVTRDGPTALRKLTGRILHLHVSDNDGKDDAHLALGRGNVDPRPVMKMAEMLGCAETCAKEGIVWSIALELGEKKEPDPDQAIAMSLATLKERNILWEK